MQSNREAKLGGHVAYIWHTRNTYRVLLRKPDGRMLQYLGDPDVDGSITLKWLNAILNT
jgi:hypothetical protein